MALMLLAVRPEAGRYDGGLTALRISAEAEAEIERTQAEADKPNGLSAAGADEAGGKTADGTAEAENRLSAEADAAGERLLTEPEAAGEQLPTEPAAETEAPTENLPKLYAQSAVLMDGDTGRVLYGKDADTVRPMASTTKIMTCVIALEYGNPDDIVTVSSYAASQPKVHLGAPAGRRFYLKDLLYSLMLESHNDTAVMIAEHVGGSVSGFAEMMNRKARELGCKNTWFVTPNGLDGEVTLEDGSRKVHGTTARDLAAIMDYCVWKSPEKERFLEITGTQNYYFSDLDEKGSYSCVNHNALLNSLKGVISGKTGFTGGAGYCYVAALEDEGRRYVLSLLGCGWPPHKTYKWSDARALFSYGTEYYSLRDIYRETELSPIPVNDGIPKSGDLSETAETDLVLDRNEDRQLLVLMKEGEAADIRAELPETLGAPVYQGDPVGRISYSLGGTPVKTYTVRAARTVMPVTFRWCAERVLSFFLKRTDWEQV